MVSSGLRPELENFTRCLVGSASEVSALMLVNLAGRRGLNCKDDERMKSCRSVIAQCWDTSPPTHCQEIIPCSLLRSQPQQRCLLESTKNLRSIIEENWQFFYWTLLKFPFLTPEFVGGRQVGEQRSLILFPAGGDEEGEGREGEGGEESNKPGNGKICRLIGAGTEGWRQRGLETFMIGHTTTTPTHYCTLRWSDQLV